MEGLGIVTDYRICSLLDAWNYEGMTTEVFKVETEQYENFSCAGLEENNIAIGFFEEDMYGDDLFGTAEKFFVESKVQVNKVFYSFYIFFGLLMIGVIGDMFITFGQFRMSTGNAVAVGGTASIALTMILMRSTAFWKGLTLMLTMAPGGGGPAVSMILALLLMGPIWWLVNQFLFGYRLGKKGVVDQFKAIETAVSADYRRGQVGREEVQKGK
ncbi:MAG: hypothetical protein GOV00_03515 [Candidatus Altiarchaeota archaeon]|nr:hypothetical protein [Candidatus Altiarchaeota archaeon]